MNGSTELTHRSVAELTKIANRIEQLTQEVQRTAVNLDPLEQEVKSLHSILSSFEGFSQQAPSEKEDEKVQGVDQKLEDLRERIVDLEEDVETLNKRQVEKQVPSIATVPNEILDKYYHLILLLLLLLTGTISYLLYLETWNH